MELFEFTNVLFEKPEKWVDVSDSEKRRHFFMANRFMGINFPLQAHVLGHVKINNAEVMNFWHQFVRKQYNRVPFWMFIKGSKKKKEEKDKKLNINSELIKEYSKAYGYELKSIYESIDVFPEKMKKEFKDFEKSRK